MKQPLVRLVLCTHSAPTKNHSSLVSHVRFYSTIEIGFRLRFSRKKYAINDPPESHEWVVMEVFISELLMLRYNNGFVFTSHYRIFRHYPEVHGGAAAACMQQL